MTSPLLVLVDDAPGKPGPVREPPWAPAILRKHFDMLFTLLEEHHDKPPRCLRDRRTIRDLLRGHARMLMSGSTDLIASLDQADKLDDAA